MYFILNVILKYLIKCNNEAPTRFYITLYGSKNCKEEQDVRREQDVIRSWLNAKLDRRYYIFLRICFFFFSLPNQPYDVSFTGISFLSKTFLESSCFLIASLPQACETSFEDDTCHGLYITTTQHSNRCNV